MDKLNFSKIDSAEKAYISGFILGDGYIPKKTQSIEVSTAIQDKEIPQYLSQYFGVKAKYVEDLRRIPKQKKYPSAEVRIYSKEVKEQLSALYGGRLKIERRMPIIKKQFEFDFFRGLFDAEGCITWGIRKDRNRVWQKFSFTSQYDILIGVQKLLSKHGISTAIKPKSKEQCFLMEAANEMDVLKIYRLLYSNGGFHLKRKKEKFDLWVTAVTDKYSFKVDDEVTPTDTRTCKKYDLPLVDFKQKSYTISEIVSVSNVKLKGHPGLVPILSLTKKGISNIPLRLELDEFGGDLHIGDNTERSPRYT